MNVTVERDGQQQHPALDHVLGLNVEVHDCHRVEQHADQQRSRDNADDVAPSAHQTDATEYDDEDDIENDRRFGDLEMHQRGRPHHDHTSDVTDCGTNGVFQ